MDDALWVGLLGPFEVRVNGVPSGPAGPRRRGVLALLAAEPNVVHPVSSIIDRLWGPDPPTSAVNLVQTYVSAWRKSLREAGACLETVGGGYRLVLSDGQSDLLELKQLRDQARQRGGGAAVDAWRAALALWRGPALADLVGQPFHPELADPLDAERLRITDLWAEAALAAGEDPGQVLVKLHDVQVREPLRESTAALAMWAHTVAGDQAVALHVYDELRRRLDEELGTIPGPGLQDMHQRILRGDAGLIRHTRDRADIGEPLVAARGELAPVDRFFGREQELADLHELVTAQRLVTLTGPGGSGKTRLAHEVLRRHLELDPYGFFVELASVRDAALAPSAMASALGLAAAAGTEPADMLMDRLADTRGLLVIDNAEHLPELEAFIARLHRGCRHLHMLVTSRQPLQVEGEHQYAVPVLPVPSHDELDHVLSQASVQLLVDRARAHDPTFQVTDDSAAHVAAIVRHLDGLPLAIEIVAPWMRLLGPAGLVDKLTLGHLNLRGRRTDVDVRHRSLRDTIAWSHDLITDAQRAVFGRLAVFQGTFSLAAAQAVCGDGTEPVDDVLFDLVDRNLIQAAPAVAGQIRFRLLGVVREFAIELLATDPDRAVVSDRMLDWYARWAAELACHSEGRESPTWQALAVAEADNLRAAIDHCSRSCRDSDLLQLVVDSMTLWFEAGHEQEGEDRLSQALERAGPEAPARAIGLTYWAWLRATRDRAGAAAAALEARELARAAEDTPVEAFALQTLGDSVEAPREAESASRAALEACDRAEGVTVRYGPTAPDAVRCGASASIAASWAHRSLPEAMRWQSEAVLRAELEGDRRIIAVNLARLARLHLLDGNTPSASALLERARDLVSPHISARWEDTVALADAELARHEGRHDDAERILRSIASRSAAAGRVLHAILGGVALADLHLDGGRSREATEALNRAAATLGIEADPAHEARLEVRRARIDREEGRPLEARRRLEPLASHMRAVDGLPPERSLWLLEVAALAVDSGQSDQAMSAVAELEAALTATTISLSPWERRRADAIASTISSAGAPAD